MPVETAGGALEGVRIDQRVILYSGLRTAEISADPRFALLRRRLRTRIIVLVALFVSWYLAYLLLTAFARDTLSINVTEHVNVALLLGLGQFLSTFVLAWAFGRFCRRRFDPLAEELRVGYAEPEFIGGRQ
ncbi:DUF485 domain-containing protein [Spiractinospora alimapuensis]|uniref:DUF485 domain-containing protein n=1 Tax=Spiractinospora alimapuensis TaxID=2820884 RepID=UPI001F4687C3|nr:DUF485 domain-containing protein [Spiractinospora alimapuensis]